MSLEYLCIRVGRAHSFKKHNAALNPHSESWIPRAYNNPIHVPSYWLLYTELNKYILVYYILSPEYYSIHILHAFPAINHRFPCILHTVRARTTSVYVTQIYPEIHFSFLCFLNMIASSGKMSIDTMVQKLDELDIDENARNRIKIFLNQKVKIGEICDDDLEKLGVLESKLAGEVTKVRHIPTKLIMARKLIYLELKPATIKQILYELELLHECNHPNIVAFYRAYQTDGGISICMEYMDGGSLDLILKRAGRISEAILAKITVAVLKGLTYLCDQHSVMYGDVKPTNVLVNSSGEIKICDFGISDQLLMALTNAFVKEDTRSYASVSH